MSEVQVQAMIDTGQREMELLNAYRMGSSTLAQQRFNYLLTLAVGVAAAVAAALVQDDVQVGTKRALVLVAAGFLGPYGVMSALRIERSNVASIRYTRAVNGIRGEILTTAVANGIDLDGMLFGSRSKSAPPTHQYFWFDLHALTALIVAFAAAACAGTLAWNSSWTMRATACASVATVVWPAIMIPLWFARKKELD